MPDDRDKPRRPSSHWDVGREHRRSHPHGVPILDDAAPEPIEDEADSDGNPEPRRLDEVTSPIDLLRRDLREDEIELLEQLGGEPGDPGPLGFLVKLATRLNDVKLDERRDNRRRADQISEVSKDAGNLHLGARVATVEKELRWWKGAVVAALLGVAGSLVAVGKGLYERGALEGATQTRIEQLEHSVAESRSDIRELRDWLNDRNDRNRHPDRAGWLTPPASPPKGNP